MGFEKCENCENRIGNSCLVFEASISKDTYIMCLEYDKLMLSESVDSLRKIIWCYKQGMTPENVQKFIDDLKYKNCVKDGIMTEK